MAYNNEFKSEIIEHLATLSTEKSGWTKELNLVSFNDAPPKYDLRSWDPDHIKMGKGITLSKDEMKVLKATIEYIDI